MNIISAPSPNYDARTSAIDMIVLHYTGMQSGEEALARLRDPEAKVSAHYMIEEDGRCFQLVAEEHRAWHAGIAHWAGVQDVNGCSIGIELVNPGHEFGPRPFSKEQMETLVHLCKDICARHDVSNKRVLGHSDVAPDRKADPGEWFDWQWLAQEGIGLWPQGEHAPFATLSDLQKSLKNIGYGIEPTGLYDEQTIHVLTAFQRRFRPAEINGDADEETQNLIRAVEEGMT